MTKERNYGIDLLRIIAMFFVVVLHSLGQGGVLSNTALNSVQYKFSWLLEIFAYCAVDIFALISGYVSYNGKEKKTNYSKYINIWLQVVFYGLLVTLIFNIISPEIVSRRDYFIVLFPVTNGLYWYFTAYTGLFILMPFINKCINNCDNETLRKIFISILLTFSVFDTIAERFELSNGYSFIWIVLMYILGAIMKKCEIGKQMKFYQASIGILIFYIVTWLYKIYGIERTILNVKITKNLFVSYTSPTVLGVAILYIIGVSKINFNIVLQNLIKFAASSTFAIYILNNHKLIWNYVMKDRFINLSNQSLIRIFIYVTGFSFIFVIGAILIDKIRTWVFKICHIGEFTINAEKVLDKIITKISNVI